MAHIGGKRVSRSHSTVIDAALPVVKALQKCEIVSNIVLGKIDVHLPTTAWRIKIMQVSGGVKLVVRGSTSIQTLYVYTQNTDNLLSFIHQTFARTFVVS